MDMSIWQPYLSFLTGAAITIVTFGIKHKFDLEKFRVERRDKYKLVAIEKRLEAHQLAFKHWMLLRTLVHDRQKQELALKEAHKFFSENSLYLEKKTREEFYSTLSRISNHSMLIENWKSSSVGAEKEKANKLVRENWDAIFDLGYIIQTDVELESIKFATDENPEGTTK